jgi:hypothetical protein
MIVSITRDATTDGRAVFKCETDGEFAAIDVAFPILHLGLRSAAETLRLKDSASGTSEAAPRRIEGGNSDGSTKNHPSIGAIHQTP